MPIAAEPEARTPVHVPDLYDTLIIVGFNQASEAHCFHRGGRRVYPCYLPAKDY